MSTTKVGAKRKRKVSNAESTPRKRGASNADGKKPFPIPMDSMGNIRTRFPKELPTADVDTVYEGDGYRVSFTGELKFEGFRNVDENGGCFNKIIPDMLKKDPDAIARRKICLRAAKWQPKSKKVTAPLPAPPAPTATPPPKKKSPSQTSSVAYMSSGNLIAPMSMSVFMKEANISKSMTLPAGHWVLCPKTFTWIHGPTKETKLANH